MKSRILIVDDEPGQRDIMRQILSGEGYEILDADGVAEAELRADQRAPDLVLTDLKMPKHGGLVLVERLSRLDFPPEIVVLTAFGTIETAVKAMRLGAYDYLNKPVDGEELLLVVRRALEKMALRRESRTLRRELDRALNTEVVAHSEAMKRILETVAKVAQSDATVLIRGESGTGKERIAQMIHRQSPRRALPFQSINCAAFPETLLESELFGYEKGAFTGAQGRKPGLIEAASGGTLFLDEIGDMSLNTQTKILRALQEKEVRRVGGISNVKVDVRIVAATHRNLEEAIRSGAFREDLFYRLNVIPILIPPLRERKEDIPPLVNLFLSRSKRSKSVDAETIETLLAYPWPGNVRELEAVLERVSILSENSVIGKSDLPPELFQAPPEEKSGYPFELPKDGIVLEQLEFQLLREAMRRAGGNMTEAAQLLGMNYRAFRYRALKFGIKE